ncbi:hypothetical protein PGT21_025928 [Puccinia graminis f. sp. tritici]|uniref:Fungal-type protein kinase domain-containing protein n=1 Tax=Puccinia graminis f. sp. tritici TaxID=56615 RepID=A0A5B0SCS0_PUCGR|nr:hypothetical protein PGT21_025928 [Puccinia graminis f. sp. tritici]KAA1135013.1 hypothetical protein PGTUg99_007735 [Puccinia graminis f. sp. tritici]
MLCHVAEENLPHVARYHHHEDVQVAGQIVDLESYVRAGIDFRSGEKIQLLVTDERVDRHKEPKEKLTNRIHRRLILKDVVQPICEVDGPVELLEALEGCMTRDIRPC